MTRSGSRFLTRTQTLSRMKRGDVPERFENYAAFRSDGKRVKAVIMMQLVRDGLVVQAKPNIGAPYILQSTMAQTNDPQNALLFPKTSVQP